MEFILTILSHIAAAFYMERPKYHKGILAFSALLYATISIFVFLLTSNRAIIHFALFFLLIIFFCVLSEGAFGEKIFLMLTYANSFCICLGIKLFFDAFFGGPTVYVALILVGMHVLLYWVVMPVYKRGRVYFRSDFWKLCPILVLFFIQFINQYAFHVTDKLSATNKLFGFIIFAAIFYSTMYVIFETVKETAEKNKQLLINDELKNIAYFDQLSGLKNRASYLKNTKEMAFRHRNDAEIKLSIAVLDIDGFKAINDSLGHTEGDHILEKVGAEIREKFVSLHCSAYRTGGDEFVILSEELSTRALERILTDLNRRIAKTIRVTISFGVATVNFMEIRPFEDAFKKADQKMYENKQEKKRECSVNQFQQSLQIL